jgi:hypothetical protein
MKNMFLNGSAIIGITSFNGVFAADENMQMGSHDHQITVMDMRISLELSPEMKEHQLSNMRSHVEAIKSIVGLIAENKFEDASILAHTKLGLTPEMQDMCACSIIGNLSSLDWLSIRVATILALYYKQKMQTPHYMH